MAWVGLSSPYLQCNVCWNYFAEPVDLFPEIPVTYSDDQRPLDSADTTLHSQSMAYSVVFQENSGFDIDFDFDEFDFTNMDDFDLGNMDAIDYEKAFMEAALSVGMDKNGTDSFPMDSSPLVLPPYTSSYHLHHVLLSCTTQNLDQLPGNNERKFHWFMAPVSFRVPVNNFSFSLANASFFVSFLSLAT